MCMGCFHSAICDEVDSDEGCEDDAHSTIEGIVAACPPVPETLAETAGLIRAWYRLADNFAVGGPLHVQLDDSNLDDEFLTEASLEEGWKWYEEDRTPERHAHGLRIMTLLAAMTEVEREMTVQAAHHPVVAGLLGVTVEGEEPYPPFDLSGVRAEIASITSPGIQIT